MDAVKQEFWGDLQADLFVANTAIYLANQSLENVISTSGRKAHKPILTNPRTGTYTPYNDITFKQKVATDQELEVSTFEYAAEEIDITDQNQTPYDLTSHSLYGIRKGLMNRVEQVYLSQISNAFHSISGSPVTVDSTSVLDIIEEAEGKLGSVDAPFETAMRAIVLGPKTVAKLRRARGERESGLGDATSQNGVVGAWNGWTVVQNNNLPWSASLKIATNPTANDTVTVAGVTFTFVASPTTAGHVDIGADAAGSRANLKAAIEGGSGAGTTYVEVSAEKRNILTRRNIACTNAEDMAFTGYGDISVSETLTAAADVWSSQQAKAMFTVRGSIDLVLQFMDLKITDKEKGFGDLTKGIIGVGAKMFTDGSLMTVSLTQDASQF